MNNNNNRRQYDSKVQISHGKQNIPGQTTSRRVDSRKVGVNNSQMRKASQIPPQLPDEEESGGSRIFIIIELLLLVFAVLSAIMFCSFLRLDYHFDYSEVQSPTAIKLSAKNDTEECLYEREIPIREPEVEPDEKLEYDFSSPVPECEPYPLEHFSRAAFIGDSRTAGLIMYTKLDPINYSATGFNLKSFSGKKYITHVDEDGKKSLVTCAEALELDKGKYDSIYLSTGVNELGWNSKTFFNSYRDTIRAIRSITDVPIYVQLILPVTTAYEEKSTNGITNAKQTEFNDGLREIIEEEQVFMLDPLSIFALEDGSLDPEKSNDGAHLEKFACAELLEYYQTHVVDTELYSNLGTAEETTANETA